MLWLFSEVSHISDPFLIGLSVKNVDDAVYRIGLVLLYLKLKFQFELPPSYVSHRKVTKVILHPTANFACLVSKPENVALFPCPLPYGLRISASLVDIPRKLPRTALMFSETGSVSGIDFGVKLKRLRASELSFPTSQFLSHLTPLLSKMVLQQLSISSLAFPMASVGFSVCIFNISSICFARYSLENFCCNSAAFAARGVEIFRFSAFFIQSCILYAICFIGEEFIVVIFCGFREFFLIVFFVISQ